jgi:MIP family channel proteins
MHILLKETSPMRNQLLRDGLAELIGTFMLVLVGAGAVVTSSNSSASVAIVALAHGLILVSIVSIFGHISGAHVNPAITLALLVGRQISITRAVEYWIAQFGGGILAALVLRFMSPPGAINLGQTVPGPGVSGVQAMIIEAILTFFLASAVIQTAVYGRLGHVAPIAIGFTLAAAILFAFPLTGASLNPARTLGPAIVTGNFRDIVFYLIGIFGGGAIAGLVHTFVFPNTTTPPAK